MSKAKSCLIAGLTMALAGYAAAKPIRLNLEEIVHSDGIESTMTIEQSITHYQKITGKDPSNWKAHLELAECYMKKPDFDNYIEDAKQAIKHYTKSISIKPTELALFHRGEAYLILFQKDKALQDHLKAAELWPDDPMAWRHVAQTYQSLGKQEKAIEVYQKILKLNPEVTKPYYAARNTNQEEDRISNLFQIASTYHELHNYEKSIEYHTKVIQLSPKFSLSYVERAEAYEHVGDHDKALKDYEKAMKLDSEEDTKKQ